MNNAVTAPALNPPWTCAVVAPTEHVWVLGSAGPKLIMARSTSTLHYDAGYMSELRFSFSTSLDGEEASIYVQTNRCPNEQVSKRTHSAVRGAKGCIRHWSVYPSNNGDSW